MSRLIFSFQPPEYQIYDLNNHAGHTDKDRNRNHMIDSHFALFSSVFSIYKLTPIPLFDGYSNQIHEP